MFHLKEDAHAQEIVVETLVGMENVHVLEIAERIRVKVDIFVN